MFVREYCTVLLFPTVDVRVLLSAESQQLSERSSRNVYTQAPALGKPSCLVCIGLPRIQCCHYPLLLLRSLWRERVGEGCRPRAPDRPAEPIRPILFLPDSWRVREIPCRHCAVMACQLILWLASGVSNEGPSSRLLVLVPPFLGPGFRLGARWNRLGEAVKTRKKRGKTRQKWARYGPS